ncbi:MAG: hypothetical protein AAF840_15045, partial [Bacteroidota bacterium]
MESDDLWHLIQNAWPELIAKESLQWYPKKSKRYRCWLQNDYCAFELVVERFEEKYELLIHDLSGAFRYPLSIFSVAQALPAARPLLAP